VAKEKINSHEVKHAFLLYFFNPFNLIMSVKPIYFSGLNGLRAIAALAVIFTHINEHLPDFKIASNPISRMIAAHSFALGQHGVTIFFVLSGFLISYLLFSEKEAMTDVNVKKFYIRRALRIWPLYYAFFVLAMTTIVFFQVDFKAPILGWYIFFSANLPAVYYLYLPILSHYWTLGVEEQFYLAWPWVVKYQRNVLHFLIFIIGFLWLLKVYFFYAHFPHAFRFVKFSRFHVMFMGALASWFYFKKNTLFLKLATSLSARILAWLSLVLIVLGKFPHHQLINAELVSLVTIVLIVEQIHVPKKIINLENGVFDFLGKISFGLYIVHPLIIFLLKKMPVGFNYFSLHVATMVLTILLAFVSYQFFEKWFIKRKGKFAILETKASING
jgi:peptidoglycan/LPS O-acetylase OafA/YrhL